MSFNDSNIVLDANDEKLLSKIWNEYKDNPDEILKPENEESINKLIDIFVEGKNKGKNEEVSRIKKSHNQLIQNVFSDLQYVKTKFGLNYQYLSKNGIGKIDSYFEPILGDNGMTLRFLMVVDENSFNDSSKRKMIYQSFRKTRSELQKHIHTVFTYIPISQSLDKERILFDGYQEF